MPAEHDLEPNAMTNEEKRQRRRFDAAFAFEILPPVVSRAQFGKGGNPQHVFERES